MTKRHHFYDVKNTTIVLHISTSIARRVWSALAGKEEQPFHFEIFIFKCLESQKIIHFISTPFDCMNRAELRVCTLAKN